VSYFVETIRKEWAVISGAPWSLATIILVVCGVVFGFSEWVHRATIDAKDATIQSKEAQIDSYKEKLSGASPEEAKAKIADLEARLASVPPPGRALDETKSLRDHINTLTEQLSVTTRERDQALQQLSTQTHTESSAPKPVAPLSDDEKQFRNDLRKFIRSTLQTHYDAFFGLANTASGGQVGGPTVSAELKPRADAAYTLLQDGLRGDFERSWRELNDATNTAIDSMDPTSIVELYQEYTTNYRKAVTNFKDYLIIVRSAEDKINFLPK
jgi:hypothetical protein